jgi:ABC-2 type transport system permease protein
MLERIMRMFIKEFIQVFRDSRLRRTVFLMPTIQLVLFGYAVTTDVRHVPVAVYDLDNTVSSRELMSRFVDSGYFDVVEYVDSDARAAYLLDDADVNAVLRVNKGFEGDLLAGRTAELQIIIDGTDSNTAAIVLGYSATITGAYSRDVLASRVSRATGFPPPARGVEARRRAWFNENLESRNFFVPGVIAMIVMLITLMFTSVAVVREKEMGTMEQIMVTPITPVEFILGKTVPFAMIGFMDVIIVTVVGVGLFNVPVRGNLILLFFSTAVFLMTSLGAGLIISTLCRTQQQAMMTVFFFNMPANLLSGFMFPIENMPTVVQWVTYVNPLRYFLVILRGIFLKGVGLEVLWPQLLALFVMGVFTLFVASRRFHKTLA